MRPDYGELIREIRTIIKDEEDSLFKDEEDGTFQPGQNDFTTERFQALVNLISNTLKEFGKNEKKCVFLTSARIELSLKIMQRNALLTLASKCTKVEEKEWLMAKVKKENERLLELLKELRNTTDIPKGHPHE